jgi:hypothetical protein
MAGAASSMAALTNSALTIRFMAGLLVSNTEDGAVNGKQLPYNHA